MKSMNSKSVYLTVITLIAWFSLALQFNLSLKLYNGQIWPTIKILLSFFTVLTNLCVAICLTALLLLRQTALGRFFARPSTQTAVAVYIFLVALVYNVALRGLDQPKGWDSLSNELLHVINPLLFVIYWFAFVDKARLEYKQTISWLIYPLLYVIFIVVRGHLIQKYPYPFINVVNIGYPKAILNTVIILIVFWILSLIFVLIGKKTAKN